MFVLILVALLLLVLFYAVLLAALSTSKRADEDARRGDRRVREGTISDRRTTSRRDRGSGVRARDARA